MNTWISKRIVPAGAALLVLSACEGGLSSVTAPLNPEALKQAEMAFGAVTLAPPDGYCIDGASLKPRFALMARCDVLGSESGPTGAPIGVITVSVTAAQTIPTPEQTATAHGLTEVRDARVVDNSVTFLAEGPAFAPNMAQSHWRGSALVKDQALSIALYGPTNNSRVSGGRQLLTELIKNTQSKSE